MHQPLRKFCVPHPLKMLDVHHLSRCFVCSSIPSLCLLLCRGFVDKRLDASSDDGPHECNSAVALCRDSAVALLTNTQMFQAMKVRVNVTRRRLSEVTVP